MSHIVRWTAALVIALPATLHMATDSPALASPMPEPSGVQAEEPVKTIEDGALDEISLYTESAPKSAPVYVELFDASNADIGTGNEEEDEKAEADQMKAAAPKLIAQGIVDGLKETGSFPSATLADEKGGDSQNLGEDIADFLHRWTTGEDID